MIEDSVSVFELKPSEIIELYRVLKQSEGDIGARLVGLVDRIERSLYERLSIEELESISSLDRQAVEALSKKL